VHVETVVSAEEGIAALTSGPCQCVVLDLGLPDASAFTFLERLQESQVLRSIPVLAHIADGADGAQSRLAGLRFGSGPLELLPSLDELRERIELHLSVAQPGDVPPLISEATPGPSQPAKQAAPGPGQPAEPPGHQVLRGRHVLVVDDDPRNMFAITSMLELYGMQVRHAQDGRAGIDALRGQAAPDVILMDVMMPEMDGHATMTAIRQMPEFDGLPIIAVTARAMPGDREKALDAGATDYVTKPVDTEELLTRMEGWLAES
jgi:CheY-like chemotaxis protein